MSQQQNQQKNQQLLDRFVEELQKLNFAMDHNDKFTSVVSQLTFTLEKLAAYLNDLEKRL